MLHAGKKQLPSLTMAWGSHAVEGEKKHVHEHDIKNMNMICTWREEERGEDCSPLFGISVTLGSRRGNHVRKRINQTWEWLASVSNCLFSW